MTNYSISKEVEESSHIFISNLFSLCLSRYERGSFEIIIMGERKVPFNYKKAAKNMKIHVSQN